MATAARSASSGPKEEEEAGRFDAFLLEVPPPPLASCIAATAAAWTTPVPTGAPCAFDDDDDDEVPPPRRRQHSSLQASRSVSNSRTRWLINNFSSVHCSMVRFCSSWSSVMYETARCSVRPLLAAVAVVVAFKAGPGL